MAIVPVTLPEMPPETGAVGTVINMLKGMVEATGVLNTMPLYNADLATPQNAETFFLVRDEEGFMRGMSPTFWQSMITLQPPPDPSTGFIACLVLTVYVNLGEVIIMALVGEEPVLPVLMKGVMTYLVYFAVYWAVLHSNNVPFALIGVIFCATLAASDFFKSFSVDAGHATFFLSMLYILKAGVGGLLFLCALQVYRALATSIASGKPAEKAMV